MATLTWEASGAGGVCSLSLEDAQHLALQARFVFSGADDHAPLVRRADLQGERWEEGDGNAVQRRHRCRHLAAPSAAAR